MTKPKRRSRFNRLLDDEVPELIKLAEEHQVTELKIQRQGTEIHLRRGPGQEAQVDITDQNAAEEEQTPTDQMHTITAPGVGYFYFPQPATSDSTPEPGAILARGHLLGVVETLDIHTDVQVTEEGELLALLVEDGQAVEYGQPIAQIQPTLPS